MKEPGEAITRSELLQVTGELIRNLHEKCKTGRFRDLDVEKARDSKLRILVSTIGICDTLLKNQEETTKEPEGERGDIGDFMDYIKAHAAAMAPEPVGGD